MPKDEEAAVPAGRPDWRDVEQYRHLLDLDRAGWAWEWMRRHPDYGRDGGDREPELDRKALSRPIVLRPASRDRARAWGLCFCRGGLLSRPAGAAALGRAA